MAAIRDRATTDIDTDRFKRLKSHFTCGETRDHSMDYRNARRDAGR